MPRVQVSNLHNLRRPKVRQSWNKLNLYILSNLKSPHLKTKTFFQQKWLAKSMTRTYHGEHVPEKRWQRLFSPKIHSARSMDPVRLAQDDGSRLSAGRGSGLETGLGDSAFEPVSQMEKTPYMQMAYHQLERRLDTAIFRALFASSIYQARQFVLHGQVKVNGQTLRHPGYLLNPGDLFSVTPEKVMLATGAPKSFVHEEAAEEEGESAGGAEAAEATEDTTATNTTGEERVQEADRSTSPTTSETKTLRDQLSAVRKDIKGIIETEELKGKAKRAFRSLMKDSLRAMSRPVPEIVDTLTHHLELLKLRTLSSSSQTDSGSTPSTPSFSSNTQPPTSSSLSLSGPSKAEAKAQAENPYDPSKPYLTPWRPRDYMSAFAFIPRYLEVNQNICSAVYLRHPVCRPGRAEVPTPFPLDISGLVFNWYLRRR